MKKLLCIFLSALVLLLAGCGGADAPALAAVGGDAEPDIAVEPADTADALPESCRIYYDAAETGGAEDGDDFPLSPRAYEGVGEVYAVRMPDGSYTDLVTSQFGEGVTLEDFSGGGAERVASTHALAWNGETYYAFSIAADNCAIPNIRPDAGGILRLEISGDCWVDGGGEEYSTFENFDCVLISGSGTLLIRDTSAVETGGRSLPVPAFIIDGDVDVYVDSLSCAPNEGCAVSAAVLRGALHTGRLDAAGGDVLTADGLLLARQVSGCAKLVFRGGTALIDSVDGDAPTVILSGGEAYIAEDIPGGTVVEAGAGTLAAGNIAGAQVNDYGASVLDRDADGSRYYATTYSTEWAYENETVWIPLSAECVNERYWFAGTLGLENNEFSSLSPWGAAHITLSGENRVTNDLGGASLLFTGGGSLTVEQQCGVWGWGAVHEPVFAVTDGAEVTVRCDEFAMGSEAGGEGLLLVDGGGFTAEHDLWLQNAVLEVRGGSVHVMGGIAIEHGGIIVSGGTLIIDGTLWLGEGNINVTGGELIIPGGADALALDAGEIFVSGGAIREP